MSNDNTDNTTTGDGNMDNTVIGEASTVHIPLPLIMVEEPKIQAKLKLPQNIHLQLQNLQQVTPFQTITLL